MAFAEPPAYRQRYFFARQQEEPSNSGPYPARGWKPDGPAFNLPQRQQQAPQVDNAYGAPQQPEPQQQYGPPQQQYGGPAQQAPTPRQQALPAAFKPSQFAKQQQPQQQYGAPQEPQQQYGAPARITVPNPREQYGAPPQQPSQQYGAPQQPQQPQQQYGAPQEPQQQYGAPQQPQQQQYGAPQQPQQQYGSPDYATTEESDIDEPTTVGALDTEVSKS